MGAVAEKPISEFWRKYGAKLKRTRRERYHADPKFRAKQRRRSLRYYYDHKPTTPRARRAKTRLLPQTTTVVVDGEKRTVRLFHAGDVQRILGRSRAGLKVWFRDGVLPKTTYRSASGYRQWTEDQLRMIRDTFRECGLGGFQGLAVAERHERLQRFRKRVHERWRRMPKGVAPRRDA